MRFLKRYFYYILFLLLFILSMRGYAYRILSENKIIGHNWDWSFPATSYFFNRINSLSSYLWFPHNLGYYNYMRMLQLFPDTLVKYLSYLFSPPLVILVLFLALFVISFCFYKLFLDKFLSKKTDANYLPSLLFSFSPFFFNDIIGGSWYMWVSFAFTPVYLYFLFSYFSNRRFIFLFFTSFFLIFVFASPHNFVALHAILLLYLVFSAFQRKFTLAQVLPFFQDLLKLVLLFMVLGLYWILPMIDSWQTIHSTVISNKVFNYFLDVKVTTQSFFNILSLNGYLNRNMYYFSLPEFLKSPFNISVVVIWIIIVVNFLKSRNRQFLSTFAIFLLLVFFIKGGNPPFSEITMWFFNKFPIFKLYRGPQHLMYIAAFLIPLLLALAIKNNKIFKILHLRLFLLLFILIWTAGWWYSGDIGYKSLSTQQRDHIDFYKLSPGLSEVYLKNETLGLNQRFLFLPSSYSPIYLANEYQGRAQGGIPEYIYLKNPTFTSESVKFADFIDTAFCKNIGFNFLNYLSLFNIGHLVVRADIVPIHTACRNIWQADAIQEKIDKLALSKNINKKLDEKYTKLYKSDPKFFLPYFYTPQGIIVSKEAVEALPGIVSQPNYEIRSTIYFQDQNENKSTLLEQLLKEIINNPIIEFKKINPTKYVVRVHQAKDSFPLVFSESFNKEWKAYLASPNRFQNPNDKLQIKSKIQMTNYKILEGNEDDQASIEELAGFIEKGWVSTLGDGEEKEIKHKKYLENGKEVLDHIEKYNIDFVSKNFQDTIQNDNLPTGYIWDTWLANKLESSKVESSKVDKIRGIFGLNKNAIQLPEENHLMANGYANSWIINVDEVCKVESGKLKSPCVKNSDGSYDFEMVIEFWPQRLFYLGLGISIVTLLLCFGYLGYNWRREKRKELK